MYPEENDFIDQHPSATATPLFTYMRVLDMATSLSQKEFNLPNIYFVHNLGWGDSVTLTQTGNWTAWRFGFGGDAEAVSEATAFVLDTNDFDLTANTGQSFGYHLNYSKIFFKSGSHTIGVFGSFNWTPDSSVLIRQVP